MAELKISEENRDDISIWKNLEKYPAWKRVVRVLQEKIEEADKLIYTPGYDSEKMFSHRDIAIVKRQAYLDLIEIPGKNISLLSGTGTEKTEQLDPYREADEEDLSDDL